MDSVSSFGLVKPDVKLEMRIAQFSLFCMELQARLGDSIPLQRVIDAEVAKILESAIEKTGKADTAKINASVEHTTRSWVGGKRYNPHWRLSDAVWAGVVQNAEKTLARKLAARGLSAQSWYLLAAKLGFNVSAPVYVESATSPKSGENTEVVRSNAGGNYGVEVTNRMPVLRFDPPGGLAALFSAITGRMNFYKQNVAHGVFNTAAATAAKYPGIYATENAGS